MVSGYLFSMLSDNECHKFCLRIDSKLSRTSLCGFDWSVDNNKLGRLLGINFSDHANVKLYGEGKLAV